MHKIGPGRRALTVFYAENYDLNANDGTDTIMLPASRGGLPQPWEPLPVELIRGSFFVMYLDLIHAGGAVPRTRPSDSWRKVGFLGVANFPVTYQFTVGLHLPFWAQPDQQGTTLNTKPRCSMERCRKQPTTIYFACNLSPLCKDHSALLCPGCDQLQPRQQEEQEAADTSSADKLMSLDCGITCYMPVDVTALYLLLQALPAPPPMPFRVDVPLPTVKPNDCLVREWVHEAEYLPSPSNKDLTLLACQPGTIAAVRRTFGGIAAVPGGEEQAVLWRWDMPPVNTPFLDPNTALQAGWLKESLKDGQYHCRCGQVSIAPCWVLVYGVLVYCVISSPPPPTNCPFLPSFLTVSLCVSCLILHIALLSQALTIAVPQSG